MSRNAKIALLAGLAAIAVVAFIALRPGGGSGSDEATTTPATTTTAAGTTATATTTPRPEIPTIRVEGGRPVGGVRKIEATEGGRIRFRVTDDAGGQVHLHGYDIEKEVGPGRPATFSVPATITGRFEVELHPATQVAEVTVRP